MRSRALVRRWWRGFGAIVVALVALLSARSAFAHEVHGEVVLFDIGEVGAEAEIQVPLGQLAAARGRPLGASSAGEVLAERDELARYIESHFFARAKDGRSFSIETRGVAVERVGDGDVLVARVALGAPAGATARWFELDDEIVLHRVTNADVYVFLRRDLQTATTGEKPPALLGATHYQKRSLVVDRAAGSRWTALGSVFSLGLRHIAEGNDHLLFLFLLLLPAPLRVARGGWGARRNARESVFAIAKIVTAFTLGHSVTLALGALGVAVISPRAVETLVAASILVSAVHAYFPLFPRREPVIAGLFGLVHGLAFASALGGFGIDRTTLVLSVLGFNSGIEAMQLAIVAVTMPWLVVLAAGPWYGPLRAGAATLGGIASLAWMAERGFGWHTALPGAIDVMAARAWCVPIVLALAALLQVAMRAPKRHEATV